MKVSAPKERHRKAASRFGLQWFAPRDAFAVAFGFAQRSLVVGGHGCLLRAGVLDPLRRRESAECNSRAQDRRTIASGDLWNVATKFL